METEPSPWELNQLDIKEELEDFNYELLNEDYEEDYVDTPASVRV